MPAAELRSLGRSFDLLGHAGGLGAAQRAARRFGWAAQRIGSPCRAASAWQQPLGRARLRCRRGPGAAWLVSVLHLLHLSRAGGERFTKAADGLERGSLQLAGLYLAGLAGECTEGSAAGGAACRLPCAKRGAQGGAADTARRMPQGAPPRGEPQPAPLAPLPRCAAGVTAACAKAACSPATLLGAAALVSNMSAGAGDAGSAATLAAATLQQLLL
jgi:hypothetical protein